MSLDHAEEIYFILIMFSDLQTKVSFSTIFKLRVSSHFINTYIARTNNAWPLPPVDPG